MTSSVLSFSGRPRAPDNYPWEVMPRRWPPCHWNLLLFRNYLSVKTEKRFKTGRFLHRGEVSFHARPNLPDLNVFPGVDSVGSEWEAGWPVDICSLYFHLLLASPKKPCLLLCTPPILRILFWDNNILGIKFLIINP